MKITTIVKQGSSYYGAKAKILNYHEERVELFLLEEEMIIEMSIEDIEGDDEVFKPSSRKDFYEFVQNLRTARRQLLSTLNYLINENLIVPKSYDAKEELIALFEDSSRDREDLISEMRRMRDESLIEFKLVNNSYSKNSRPQGKRAYSR